MTDRYRAPVPEMSRGQIAACVGSVVIGVALAAYGAAGSYQTAAAVAVEKHLPLPELVPLGLDGGLLGIVLVDLVLTWISCANPSGYWPSALSPPTPRQYGRISWRSACIRRRH
ncbi:DUF2637 domain-containing protein [Saccharopolyspora sp. 6V]|nr:MULTISPECIES: DUF2637 domain-containing protein [unclassified Saccharopolyspora]MCA1190011.1 DUF2637 domain-containing protein [Saccharopolyspora sp. 6T]MCA1194611.1 DUF2637 domain-containing protein [Saccharopolyspora sp. 6V]MCA1224935.1 DUF2637 domain-containing protein [Saccharopolyspora sp. 6M]MCA1279718.1 DUF2637 domain-containing protein [Saccharopolyspora sp. 7B]